MAKQLIPENGVCEIRFTEAANGKWWAYIVNDNEEEHLGVVMDWRMSITGDGLLASIDCVIAYNLGVSYSFHGETLYENAAPFNQPELRPEGAILEMRLSGVTR